MTVISPVSTDNDLFHIVFLIVLFSISLQGSLLPWAARRLGMIDEAATSCRTFTDYVDEAPVQFIQFTVPLTHPWCGARGAGAGAAAGGAVDQFAARGGAESCRAAAPALQRGDRLILAALEPEGTPGVCLSEKTVEPDDLRDGARVADLPLRAGALIVLVQRGEEYLIPRGDTELQPGDLLVINSTEQE